MQALKRKLNTELSTFDDKLDAMDKFLDSGKLSIEYDKMVDIENWAEMDGILVDNQCVARNTDLPRMETHEHGFVVYCDDYDHGLETAIYMLSSGFTIEFTMLYLLACKDGAMLINMDRG